jgi:signal transduction histidine kinase
LGDRVQIQQVMLNLIMNSIEAMKDLKEQPKLLQITTQLDGSDHVGVSIIDTGVGITDVGDERIFESFFTTKPEGMGMGLSICRSIVEAHGGRLWATANYPHGCNFTFTLPAFSSSV